MRRRFMNESKDYFDYTKYMTIEALDDLVSITFPRNIEYGIDGVGWKGATQIIASKNQFISVRCILEEGQKFRIDTMGIIIYGKCRLRGNALSLIFGDYASDITDISAYDSVFADLFKDCDSIQEVEKNFLPATILAKHCYERMFANCTSLTKAPELPATTLAQSCYYQMFFGCKNLIDAPTLPATTLANNCYNGMFGATNLLPDCSNIDFTSNTVVASGGLAGLFSYTKVTDDDLMNILPINNDGKYYLPATTLANNCYDSMFFSCEALTTAPELPATTLANNCYKYMFFSCKALTTAPELPATTLTDWCYNQMFSGCSKLNYIKMLATDISADYCLSNWVNGVASTGTFVKNPAMNSLPTGDSGIPEGWTVVNDEEESGGNAIPNNQIHYTSIDNAIVYPYYKTGFGANIVSNTNENGLGIITFDGDITTFESYVYAEVEDLTSITIPNSVTLIEFNAFDYCEQLTSVTIGEGVTDIKKYAFWGCSSLSSVYCKAKTPPSIENGAFGNNASGRKIYVPMESVDAYMTADGWIDYANDIVGYNF